ncbi:4613_t:CDS:1, partial [Scutellospora calospora]
DPMNKQRLIFLIVILSLFDLVHFSNANIFKRIPVTCSGKRNCHVQCDMSAGSMYTNNCSVKTCTFTSNSVLCDGSCANQLDYAEERACHFSCGTACTYNCSKCKRTGPNASDWACTNCK